MLPNALGGIGLFLVGMVLVTDSLRAAAGDALRTALVRFTGGPFKALLSGAAVTALVQSSSATTVATIGFVGAGLLTFEQALGIILGANIGTTATGWMVALLGLKFSVSTVALPLVGVGALLRLFTRGRASHLGLALSGFGIIFVGIDVLQAGMAAASNWLTPDALPPDTWGGRLVLVGIGTLMTTIMQSSSAGVAATLTALSAGTISLHQAAAMVIGINVGTTVTAGLAAIGTSTAARRTAFAHLLFNGVTGTIAFATLPAFVWAIGQVGARIAPGDATVMLAAFHTAFNLVGVALIVPFSGRFAHMVTRVIRHHGPVLTRLLDPTAARNGAMAAEAVRQTAVDIAQAATRTLDGLLARRKLTSAESEVLDAAAAALRETEDYVATLQFPIPMSEAGHQRYVSTIHALDHLGRVLDAALSAPAPENNLSPEQTALEDQVRTALQSVLAWTMDPKRAAPTDSLRHLADTVTESRHSMHDTLLAATAAGRITPVVAGKRLDRMRWLRELTHHMYRLVDHLQGERRQLTQEPVHPRITVAQEPLSQEPGSQARQQGETGSQGPV